MLISACQIPRIAKNPQKTIVFVPEKNIPDFSRFTKRLSFGQDGLKNNNPSRKNLQDGVAAPKD